MWFYLLSLLWYVKPRTLKSRPSFEIIYITYDFFPTVFQETHFTQKRGYYKLKMGVTRLCRILFMTN